MWHVVKHGTVNRTCSSAQDRLLCRDRTCTFTTAWNWEGVIGLAVYVVKNSG